MANLTERDYIFFRALRLGVTRLDRLSRLLKRAFATVITEGAIVKRLHFLKSDGYIVSFRCPARKRRNHFTVYALSEKGAKELVFEEQVPISEIRTGIPKQMRHELLVTYVLQTLERERAEGLYTFTYEDSSAIRKMRQKGDRGLIPDIRLWLAPAKIPEEMRIDIEVDTGSIPPGKMYSRILEFKDRNAMTLIICLRKTGMDALVRKCSNLPATREFSRICFVQVDEFCQKGFRHAPLTRLDGKQGMLILRPEQEVI